jgi:hypothetical protein
MTVEMMDFICILRHFKISDIKIGKNGGGKCACMKFKRKVFQKSTPKIVVCSIKKV